MVDGLSDFAAKVYEAMKHAGIDDEEKMITAERVTFISKLPKNRALSALQELQQKGYVRRKAREKAAGYYILK